MQKIFDIVSFFLGPAQVPLTKYRRQKGFTLLELMIVIAIIGTLAAIAVPSYLHYMEKTRYFSGVTMMKRIEREVKDFYIVNTRYPATLAEIGLGDVNDPWGNEYRYLDISTVKGKGKLRKDRSTNPLNTDFDLYSIGPDGKSQLPLRPPVSHDDIIRANNGIYIGRASDY